MVGEYIHQYVLSNFIAIYIKIHFSGFLSVKQPMEKVLLGLPEL